MDIPSPEGCIKRGWLMKKGGIMKTTWQPRYFALSGTFLIYYLKEDDIKSQGSILLGQHRILEQPINPDEPDHFIFEIVLAKNHRNSDKKTDNHETVCLCASSDADRQGWIKALRHALYAHLGGAIFGQKFEETMKYTHKQNRKMPYIIEECVEFLYKNALDIEGIFRLPGRSILIRELKERFDCGEKVSLSAIEADVHSVSSVLKLYLRELPESVIPCRLYQKFMNYALHHIDAKEESEKMEVVAELKSYMPSLPVDNYNILKYLCRMLNAVGQNHIVNKMSMMSIGIVFGPNIIRHMDDNPELFMLTADLSKQLAFMLINYFDILFELEYDSGAASPEPVPVEDLLNMSTSDDRNPVLKANVMTKRISELDGLQFENDDVFQSNRATRNEDSWNADSRNADSRNADSRNAESPASPLSPLSFSGDHFSASEHDVVLRKYSSDSSTASQSDHLPVSSPRFTEDGRPIPPKRKPRIVRGRRVSNNRPLSARSEGDSSVNAAVSPEQPEMLFSYDASGAQTDRLLGTKETQTDGNWEKEKNAIDSMQVNLTEKDKKISELKAIVTKNKSRYDSMVKVLRAEIDNMKEIYEKRIGTLEAVFKTQNAKYEAESKGRAEAVEVVVQLKQQLHQYQMQYGDL